MKRFQGRLGSKVHRLVYLSTLGSRVKKNQKKNGGGERDKERERVKGSGSVCSADNLVDRRHLLPESRICRERVVI